MMGVVGRVKEGIISGKQALLDKILNKQKPVLDQKIDAMLKDIRKVNRITIKALGVGASIGKRLGGVARKGASILKSLRG